MSFKEDTALLVKKHLMKLLQLQRMEQEIVKMTYISAIGYVDKYSPKPTSITFPDGWSKTFLTRGWVNVLRATTQWLIMTGKLREENSRLPHPDMPNFWIIFPCTETHHPQGTKIRRPEYICSGICINTNAEAYHHLSGSIWLLESFDIDAKRVFIHF